jgi:hypothetical protein
VETDITVEEAIEEAGVRADVSTWPILMVIAIVIMIVGVYRVTTLNGEREEQLRRVQQAQADRD